MSSTSSSTRIVRAFMANPVHFELETGQRSVLRLNKVLDWYGDDFGGTEGLREFFAPYLEGDEGGTRLGHDTRIEFFEYDWTLNDVPR